MSVQAESPTRQARANREFKAFDREIGTIVATLVNDFGVRMRMPDGGHILLYSNEKGTRPYKISASRAKETSLRFLMKWIEKNVPEYHGPTEAEIETDTKPLEVTPEQVAAAEAQRPRLVKDKPKIEIEIPTENPISEPIPALDWLVFGEGDDARTSEYLYWDSDVVRCVQCDYTSQQKAGSHLHENKHTGKAAEVAAMGRAASKTKAAERRETITEGIHAMAKHFGIAVGSTSDKEVAKMRKQIEDLTAKVEALTEERDTLKAKVDLIREGLKL